MEGLAQPLRRENFASDYNAAPDRAGGGLAWLHHRPWEGATASCANLARQGPGPCSTIRRPWECRSRGEERVHTLSINYSSRLRRVSESVISHGKPKAQRQEKAPECRSEPGSNTGQRQKAAERSFIKDLFLILLILCVCVYTSVYMSVWVWCGCVWVGAHARALTNGRKSYPIP